MKTEIFAGIPLSVKTEFLIKYVKDPHEIIDLINQFVADYFKISLSDMLGKSRLREFAEPRQIAHYLCRKFTNKTLHIIAKKCNKDHATCLHSAKAVKNLIQTNRIFREKIQDIEEKLNYHFRGYAKN